MEMGGAARLVGLFNAFDLNGDAKIDVYEWCRSVSLLTRGSRAQLVEFLFDVYDLDSTGHITVDKLVLFTSPGAQGEDYLPAAVFAKNVLSLFDANGDDQVDKQEFMTTLSEHHLLCVRVADSGCSGGLPNRTRCAGLCAAGTTVLCLP